AGRSTLLEAASLFHTFNQTRSTSERVGVRCYHKGEREEVLSCREVIRWVVADLEMADPCLALAVGSCFVYQLEDHIRYSTLRLTDLSPVVFADPRKDEG